MKRISEESGMLYRLEYMYWSYWTAYERSYGIPSLQQELLLPMLCTFDLGQCSLYKDKIIVEWVPRRL